MKPLEGVRVLDLSRVLAGPSATMALAELGATVVKVELPGTGDESRTYEPKYPGGESAYFMAFNRGKQSVTLNFKSAEGRRIARDLIGHVDVVVENFLPGVLARYGLGYDDLSAEFPALVYVSATGFGQSGPRSAERGYDTVFQAMSGLMHMTGHPDGPPAKVGVPISDLAGGMWVAIAVLTGLTARHLHGRGGYFDVALSDVSLSLQALNAARLFTLDEEPLRTGTEHPGRVPSAAFATSDGQWLDISGSDHHWKPLCEALGLVEMAVDPSLTRNSARVARRGEVMQALSAAISALTCEEAMSRLSSAEVPVGRVVTVSEALSDANTVARKVVQSFEHPTEGAIKALRTPLRIRGYENPDVLPTPVLGADTASVLGEWLGLSAETVQRLRAEGTV